MSSNRAISVQLSIKAPKGTPPEIIREAIAHKCEHDEDTPGIEIRVIDWTGRKDTTFNSDDAFRRLRGPIKAAYVRFPPHRKG